MQLTNSQLDALERRSRSAFDGSLDQFLMERFPQFSAADFGRLRSACRASCLRLQISTGEGIYAFHEASFLLGVPIDQTPEFMMALTRAVLIGWAPDQVAIDLLDLHR